MRREYRGAAQSSVLTSALGGTTAELTIFCNDLTNWPTGAGNKPFYVVIDRGRSNEEKILCSSRSANTLTVYNTGLVNGRGADGTPLSSHTINAVIEHVFTATDADEANAHVNSASVHIADNQRAVTVCTSTTRPAVPVANELILETDTRLMYSYVAGGWVAVAGATGGGSGRAFWENDVTISANYTITSGKNAGSFGPVTVGSGVTVTVPSGSTWTVV